MYDTIHQFKTNRTPKVAKRKCTDCVEGEDNETTEGKSTDGGESASAEAELTICKTASKYSRCSDAADGDSEMSDQESTHRSSEMSQHKLPCENIITASQKVRKVRLPARTSQKSANSSKIINLASEIRSACGMEVNNIKKAAVDSEIRAEHGHASHKSSVNANSWKQIVLIETYKPLNHVIEPKPKPIRDGFLYQRFLPKDETFTCILGCKRKFQCLTDLQTHYHERHQLKTTVFMEAVIDFLCGKVLPYIFKDKECGVFGTRTTYKLKTSEDGKVICSARNHSNSITNVSKHHQTEGKVTDLQVSDLKRFQCLVYRECKAMFASELPLQVHMLNAHSTKTEFVSRSPDGEIGCCHVCGSFQSDGTLALRQHFEFTHFKSLDVDTFSCAYCFYAGPSMSRIRQHIEKYHFTEKCPLCFKHLPALDPWDVEFAHHTITAHCTGKSCSGDIQCQLCSRSLSKAEAPFHFVNSDIKCTKLSNDQPGLVEIILKKTDMCHIKSNMLKMDLIPLSNDLTCSTKNQKVQNVRLVGEVSSSYSKKASNFFKVLKKGSMQQHRTNNPVNILLQKKESLNAIQKTGEVQNVKQMEQAKYPSKEAVASQDVYELNQHVQEKLVATSTTVMQPPMTPCYSELTCFICFLKCKNTAHMNWHYDLVHKCWVENETQMPNSLITTEDNEIGQGELQIHVPKGTSLSINKLIKMLYSLKKISLFYKFFVVEFSGMDLCSTLHQISLESCFCYAL